MAESRKDSEIQSTSEDLQNGARRAGTAVMGATLDAADVVRSTAERAAARLPEAVAGAQVAAAGTQRVLDEMPSQALLIGTSFSVGLGVGLFVSGANRLLVTLALAPAAAMALTIFGREQGPNGSRTVSASGKSTSRGG